MPTVPISSGSYLSYAGASPLDPSHPQWSSLVGIVTAIVGNVLISFALNIQRYAHIRIDQEYRDHHDHETKNARKNLPKSLRNYGTAVEQEEVAEERQRINENSEVPSELNGYGDSNGNAKLNHQNHASDSTLSVDEDEDEQGSEGRKSYLKSPWWWLGIILMTIGETGNFLAYGFAPASIVSPLGVVALISNCLIAPLMLKERFRQRDFWGVLIAIAGAVTVVLSAKTNEKKLGAGELWHDIKRWEFLAYVLITTVCITALMFASPKYGRRTILVDLGLVGLFGGYTVLSTKGVASLLSTSLYLAFKFPIFYALVFILVTSAVMQIRYLNRGLQNFDSTQVIPVQFVMFTLSVIIGSAVLYRDFERTDLDHVLKFVFGCLLTFSGVYLITSGRMQQDDDESDDAGEHDVERIRLLDEEVNEQETTPTKQERDLKLDTTDPATDVPATPRPLSSRASSLVPSIAITPAASADDINNNPWASSTDHLARVETNESTRPYTPPNQTIPSASTSQTPFFTPSTTQKPKTSTGYSLERSISGPAQSETPLHRGPSPPRPSIDERVPLSTISKQRSISRLLPYVGPILQPLSSSLSGIVADRILKGEGTPSSSTIRQALKRNRSNRESTANRQRSLAGGASVGASELDLETGFYSSVFTSESSVLRAKDARRVEAAVGGEDSPLRRRSAVLDSVDEADRGFGGSLKKAKGRLRSMSETLGSFMKTSSSVEEERSHNDDR